MLVVTKAPKYYWPFSLCPCALLKQVHKCVLREIKKLGRIITIILSFTIYNHPTHYQQTNGHAQTFCHLQIVYYRILIVPLALQLQQSYFLKMNTLPHEKKTEEKAQLMQVAKHVIFAKSSKLAIEMLTWEGQVFQVLLERSTTT